MSDVEKVAQPSLVWLLTWLHDIGRHTEDHPVSWQITCSPEQARAAYSALAAARPDEWQPIESAPEDCSDILLAHCWNRLTRVEICVAESGPAAFITPQADIPRASYRLLGWMRLPDTSALRRPKPGEG